MNKENTGCIKFFEKNLEKINGYERHPEISGKNPDFKISPFKKDIYLECYQPEATKIRKLKDKTNWGTHPQGRCIGYSLTIDDIKAMICFYIKEKKKKGQLSDDELSILVLDLSMRFHESIHFSDLLSIFNEDDLQSIFKIHSELNALIFYNLALDPSQNRPHIMIINKNPCNKRSLTDEEIGAVRRSLR